MAILNEKDQKLFFEIYGPEFYITDEKMVKMFGRNFKTKKVLFNVYDEITIGPKESKFVRDGTITTIGSFIFNKTCIEHMEVFGYIDKALDGSVISDIADLCSIALKDDDITVEQYSKYIDRCQYLFGGVLSSIINSSITEDILQLPPKARKLRDELYKKYMDKLVPVVDPLIAQMIESEVCKIAKDEIRKNNPSAMDIFDSKCGVSFENNYKTMFVMKGVIQDNTGEYPNGYKIVTSNYNSGISKDEYHKFADSLTTSAYAKGKSVATGGYVTKRFNALFQNVKLADKGSDCKTPNTNKVFISNNDKSYLYRYIVEGGKYILLNNDNISKYYGKYVNMRSPLYCHSDDYCNICYGELKYILGITNVGLAFNTASNSLLNASMKKFHDITIKTYTVDIEKDILSYMGP